MAISTTSAKVTVRKVINMMNFSPLSPKAWSRITRNAISWKQEYDSMIGYKYIVAYSNGIGASIVKAESSYGSEDDLWDVTVLKGGVLYIGKDSNGRKGKYMAKNCTEDDVVLDCIFFSGL